MRIAVMPSDRTGVGQYRLLQPARAVRQQEAGNLEVDVIQKLPLEVNRDLERVGVHKSFDYDVFVLQRPTADWQLLAVRDLKRKGVRIVVDVDDDFSALSPKNPAFWNMHPKSDTQESFHTLGWCCQEADLVTVSTEPLARRYGAHGRVRILPNYVSEGWLTVVPQHGGRTVGWAGAVAWHPEDLQATRGGVAAAIEQVADSEFKVVGDPTGVKEQLGLKAAPLASGWMPFEDYPKELATLDVGIVPLADSKFNRAKSWSKGVEMAATGVVPIMSPIPDYERLHDREKIGLISAPRKREWLRAVKELLKDRSLRNEMALAGRASVRQRLTIERNAWKWTEAWAG